MKTTSRGLPALSLPLGESPIPRWVFRPTFSGVLWRRERKAGLQLEDQSLLNEKIVHSCVFSRLNGSTSSNFACNYLGCMSWRVCPHCSMTLKFTWMISLHGNPKHIFILSSSILLSRVQKRWTPSVVLLLGHWQWGDHFIPVGLGLSWFENRKSCILETFTVLSTPTSSTKAAWWQRKKVEE